MRHTLLVLMTGGLLALSAAQARAEVHSFLTLDYVAPAGDLADTVEPGYGGSGEVFAVLPLLPVRLGIHLGYSRLPEGEDAGAGDLAITRVVPAVKYQIWANDVYSYWTQLGLGMYQWRNDSSDGNDMGMLFGLGFSRQAGDLVRLVLMPTYQTIFAEDISFFTMNVGLGF